MATNQTLRTDTVYVTVPSGFVSGDVKPMGVSGSEDFPVLVKTDRDADNKAHVVLPYEAAIVYVDVQGRSASADQAGVPFQKFYRDGTDYNFDGTNGTEVGRILDAVAAGTGTTNVRAFLTPPTP